MWTLNCFLILYTDEIQSEMDRVNFPVWPTHSLFKCCTFVSQVQLVVAEAEGEVEVRRRSFKTEVQE